MSLLFIITLSWQGNAIVPAKLIEQFIQCAGLNLRQSETLKKCVKKYSTKESTEDNYQKLEEWVMVKGTPKPSKCNPKLNRSLGYDDPKRGQVICYKLVIPDFPKRKIFFFVIQNRISEIKVF